MGDHLAVVLHALGPALVEGDYVARIQNLADRIPFHSTAAFECRLGAGAAQVDFHVSLPASQLQNVPCLEGDAAWRILRDLARWYADSYCVLEYDVSALTPTLPAPGFFLPMNCGSPGSNFLRLRGIFDEELHSTALGPFWPRLECCFTHLPASSVIHSVGFMLSRSRPAAKVNVHGLSPEELADYLSASGWSGDTKALGATVSRITPWADELDVALDLSAIGIGAPIGLECYLRRGPAEEPRWNSLFDYLAANGLCTPEKTRALIEWPGIDWEETSASWPASLAVADRYMNSVALSYFYRRISHIKVTFESGRLQQAKAYLMFGHHWRARDIDVGN